MPYQRLLRLDPLAFSERYRLGAYAGADYGIYIAKGFSIVPVSGNDLYGSGSADHEFDFVLSELQFLGFRYFLLA